MSFNFVHLPRLGDHPRQFAFVLSTFADQTAAGNYPAGRRVPDGNEQCWIVTDKAGELVGFATHYIPDNTGLMWLDLLYVDWDVRRQQIGRELIALVSGTAREQNCNRVEWGTGIENAPMNALSGICQAEHIGNYYRLPLLVYADCDSPMEAQHA